ncbi:glycosyltransferase [Arthrobacter sp. zg-Y1143]|uniref:glycosyltransferase family 2 protein n=1 Tax=Arthrobacter sp. zg-Y1143 TaxID=3049065 RepID=UPI0024C28CA7|nr:glycosyltransferase [Arthrobacter sp. zg-Y1143]MDK1328471.1 glycosyltransferase [Arthrobacter sp. zg-Y1143]
MTTPAPGAEPRVPAPPAAAGPVPAPLGTLQAQLIIAVLTYKRPEDLAVALPRLLAQARSAPVPAQVLVVDNDPDGGARATVAAAGDSHLVYVHEPRPGIAAARNRALREAYAVADLLAFIDDDEVPSEQWLDRLSALQKESGATAVVGPVLSEYEVQPDEWITAGDFFRRRRLATGSVLSVAATNNLLLDLNRIRSLGLEFDERFGLSGGSDTLFSRQLVRAGGKMLWCDEAAVVDRVPASRLTRRWVLLRAFRSGNCHSRVALATSPTAGARAAARIRLLGPGTVRCAGGGARWLLGALLRSPAHNAKGLRTAARGAGMVTGAFGYVFSEYKRK